MSHTPANHPQSQALVRGYGLCKSFNGKQVLNDLDVEFAPHRTTVVLGPSGCGKSVMLKHLIGLLRPDSGEVYFDDTRIDTMPETKMTPIRRQFGFLFQMGALFDSLNVRANIEFPLVESGITDPEERHERVLEVLAMVGLTDTEAMMPADLSGGQRKRIALARSIVLRPRVILYDEPTTGLDPIRSDVINELILKLQTEMEATSIVVTHDLTSAFKVADHMLLMLEGKIVMQGPPSAFKDPENPEVARFMQGRASDDELAAIRKTTGKIGVCS
jgi:phospholipid/cholesterol/gamma-HCH transport system ATP-binding protein